jgi:hypothetical protein
MANLQVLPRREGRQSLKSLLFLPRGKEQKQSAAITEPPYVIASPSRQRRMVISVIRFPLYIVSPSPQENQSRARQSLKAIVVRESSFLLHSIMKRLIYTSTLCHKCLSSY